jgi:hypothetical protein
MAINSMADMPEFPTALTNWLKPPGKAVPGPQSPSRSMYPRFTTSVAAVAVREKLRRPGTAAIS